MSDNSKRRPKIDCPWFGKRLFWPFYRLLNADEFSAFPADTDIRSKEENAVNP